MEERGNIRTIRRKGELTFRAPKGGGGIFHVFLEGDIRPGA